MGLKHCPRQRGKRGSKELVNQKGEGDDDLNKQTLYRLKIPMTNK
ncbi:hypothetical protein SAMN05192534_105129 [Alteribacillus persepolensis]|uniref:Uncharacterized protein n=1 Tax=Alteribacillus persepolensis TaxID=568899 RepID=A0A1G8CBJ9_9BACI|nr:hypothetical protein [Alteribacillus persepolensis]SDH42851.1 hypothetical protein SAMN05192534_105129 [Alteribacillus persepolensis]